jgi:nucleotide-binding universal stress UspA family protein
LEQKLCRPQSVQIVDQSSGDQNAIVSGVPISSWTDWTNNERDSVRCTLAQNTIGRWSRPELILFATDFSGRLMPTLHTIYQAKLTGAKVLLVHVVPSHLQADACLGFRLSEMSSDFSTVRAKMDQMINEVEMEGILCEPVALNGVPAEQIPALVKSRGVDRVIVATRIESGVERFLDESLAEDLMASLEVPVFIFGPNAQANAVSDPRPRQVLLATSFRPGNSVCTGFASAFAELHDAQLTMLHVLDAGGMSEQQRERARVAARQKLSAYIPNEARLGRQPVITIREGDPSAKILEESSSFPNDLIILGSPSSSMVSRILTGSVVHHVITEARCPVVTIRPTASTLRDVIRESFDLEPRSRLLELSPRHALTANY